MWSNVASTSKATIPKAYHLIQPITSLHVTNILIDHRNPQHPPVLYYSLDTFQRTSNFVVFEHIVDFNEQSSPLFCKSKGFRCYNRLISYSRCVLLILLLEETRFMDFKISDEFLGTVAPLVVYWVYSGFYVLFGSNEKYRLHSIKEEDEKNLVSKRSVVKGVLLQQAVQAIVAMILFTITGSDESSTATKNTSLFDLGRQFITAMVVLDTWQYFIHRYMHQNKFLYRHIHSLHHRLIVPYAYGALYNHPIEGLLLDTVGGALAFLLSGMSPRASIFFFSFATIKTVDDHCGLWLPGNLFHIFFKNNSAYHDVHHQLYGTKYNYSQPFFVVWDKILGTHMPYTLEKRENGGFEVRPVKVVKDE